MFSRQGKECLHLLDAALGNFERREVPSLQEKRVHSMRLKKEFAEGSGSALAAETGCGTDARYSITISENAAEDMEKAYVLEDEIREVVTGAEDEGDYFSEAGGSVRIACAVKPVVTIWAVYIADGRDITVTGVYAHRMHFVTENR
jgi:hypothetical protein